MVMYCNAACKKKHRHKHKQECEEHVRLAAEQATKLHDEKLFKQPPMLYGDCPICFLRIPTLLSGSKYKTCCGKVICSGCNFAPVYDHKGSMVDETCPFCRAAAPRSDEEAIERLNKRVNVGDAEGISNLGFYYAHGVHSLPQDNTKAFELWLKAAEFGHVTAYFNIGTIYDTGMCVEVDNKKANHYYELAAMGGDIKARHNLGCSEVEEGNIDRAIKHWMIAVASGEATSLAAMQSLYSDGRATKEEFTQALRSYQEYLGEIKSSQRDEAAAYSDIYKYY